MKILMSRLLRYGQNLCLDVLKSDINQRSESCVLLWVVFVTFITRIKSVSVVSMIVHTKQLACQSLSHLIKICWQVVYPKKIVPDWNR